MDSGEDEDIRDGITSLREISEYADAVRSIENQLHRNLDVTFREYAARARKDNSTLNMSNLRKAALTLVDQAKYGRVSIMIMRFISALNPQMLLKILFQMKK